MWRIDSSTVSRPKACTEASPSCPLEPFFGERQKIVRGPFLLFTKDLDYFLRIRYNFKYIHLIYNSIMCETISNGKDSLKLKQVHIKKSNLIHRNEGDVIGLRDQGYPGFLTEKEYEIFVSIPFIHNYFVFFSAFYC